MKRVPPRWQPGAGQHEWPREGRPSQLIARHRFLEVMHALEPAVLRDLASEPLRRYRPLYEQADPKHPERHEEALRAARATHGHRVWVTRHRAELDRWEELDGMAGREDGPYCDQVPLHRSLRDWARFWHLEAPWCLDAALAALRHWCDSPERVGQWFPYDPAAALRRARELGILHTHPDDAEAPCQATTGRERFFAFVDPGWEPTYERRDEAVARIRHAFDVALDRYIARMAALAEERGATPTPERRKLDQHLTWLARYQVQGWTYGRIAGEIDRVREQLTDEPQAIDQKSVEIAIRGMAKSLELPLRSAGRRGRPPKSPAAGGGRKMVS